MANAYPFAVLENYGELVGHIDAIDTASEDIGAIFSAIEKEAEKDNNAAIVIALARAGHAHVVHIEAAWIEISEYCRAADVARVAYRELDAAIATVGDVEDGQALRDLSRDMAVMLEKIAKPAFRAITEMQNRAVEIDAMIRRARDMAGCLRWEQPADRDPDQPEIGTLAHTVGETMDDRTIAFAAAIQRAKMRDADKGETVA